MQTFLPYPDFQKTAETLDYRRLGKQRLEAKQILNAMTTGGGWSHHPATLMWKGYEPALMAYYNGVVREWIARGYRNTMPFMELTGEIVYPPWFGREDFHSVHRAALLAKDYGFYSKYGWSEDPGIAYIWPVMIADLTR